MAILASIVYICIKDGIYLVTSHNPFMSSVKLIIPIDDASSYLPKLQFDASELNNVVLGVFDHSNNYYKIVFNSCVLQLQFQCLYPM